jgi:hypothetical protein
MKSSQQAGSALLQTQEPQPCHGHCPGLGLFRARRIGHRRPDFRGGGCGEQRVQARANIVANEITLREDLYKDFIMAASTAYGDALLTNEPKGSTSSLVSMPS